MVDDRDLSLLIKWAESQGWKVKTDASGYRRFHDPEGNYITNFPANAWQVMATDKGTAARVEAGRATGSAAQ